MAKSKLTVQYDAERVTSLAQASYTKSLNAIWASNDQLTDQVAQAYILRPLVLRQTLTGGAIVLSLTTTPVNVFTWTLSPRKNNAFGYYTYSFRGRIRVMPVSGARVKFGIYPPDAPGDCSLIYRAIDNLGNLYTGGLAAITDGANTFTSDIGADTVNDITILFEGQFENHASADTTYGIQMKTASGTATVTTGAYVDVELT